ncbi:MAG: LamB/YcsF family protein [Microbacteriaceae bacterium]|jgi:UPF0271 protein|nr:LamB/YcsF family protein [Microbacteriaceae bacterium]MCI1207347.1 LamB/YcsF family protein [Microbacteriaceae bacterium]
MQVDINSDMGESFGRWTLGDDRTMLGIVTSANIACGFHAGDPVGIRATLSAASDTGVSVGAHVAYRDLAGFGRRNMDVSAAELTAGIVYQVGALRGLAESVGTTVSYVKPHGALYNRIAHDEVQARAVVEALQECGGLPLLTLPGSVVGRVAADAGLRVVHEVFADRAYQSNGELVPRSAPRAVLHDPDRIADRMLTLLQTERLTSIEGDEVVIPDPASICVHSDTPGAVQMAQALRTALQTSGVDLRRFV